MTIAASQWEWTPAQVADEVIEGLAAEQFLILPHKEVIQYRQRKADDYDRWRGGMRSASMAWLFETAGMECYLLEGGYKSFRKFVLAFFNQDFPFLVIGGLTGSGKTAALKSLAGMGEQILDLEDLANHGVSEQMAEALPSVSTACSAAARPDSQ